MNERVALPMTLAGQDPPGPRGGLEVFIDARLDTEINYDTVTTGDRGRPTGR